MSKLKKRGLIILICCVIFIVISFIIPKKIYGKWYLYNGNNISTDTNIVKQLNPKDYIEISERTMKTFTSDGKDGIGECNITFNKIHSGDTIYNFNVSNVGEYKILVLEEIGYDDGHTEESIKNGHKSTYVFDKKIEFKE
ncbi:hypothetical protein ACWG0P_07590 [Amedibacillus sp. YH-ame6]